MNSVQDIIIGLRERTWLSPVSAEEMNRRDRWLADAIDAATHEWTNQVGAVVKKYAYHFPNDDITNKLLADLVALAPAPPQEQEPMTELKGTYNCPICGWNEPHSEHAGEMIQRLSQTIEKWEQWAELVRRNIVVIRTSCAESAARRLCDELSTKSPYTLAASLPAQEPQVTFVANLADDIRTDLRVNGYAEIPEGWLEDIIKQHLAAPAQEQEPRK